MPESGTAGTVARMSEDLQFDRPSPSLYLATIDGREVCRVAVAVGDGVWELFSTVTAAGFEGRGIAGRLVRHVLGEAEAAGVGVIPSCWYVDGLMRRDPQRWEHLRHGASAPAAEAGDACRIAPAVLPPA
jgi:predicted GNAT family acetyltransferase